jgi:hypothetical protein
VSLELLAQLKRDHAGRAITVHVHCSPNRCSTTWGAGRTVEVHFLGVVLYNSLLVVNWLVAGVHPNTLCKTVPEPNAFNPFELSLSEKQIPRLVGNVSS